MYYRYQIDSPEINNTYVINVNITVCYETDRCELNLRILTDHVVDRIKCDYRSGFLDKCKFNRVTYEKKISIGIFKLY